MKWLITGGAGFIGVNLIRELMQSDRNVIRVYDDLSVGTFEALAEIAPVIELDGTESAWASEDTGQIQLVRASILDEGRVARAASGFDVIVHLAANTGVAPSVADPRADCMANVVGTLNCLEAARHSGVKRFIFASSGAPVGDVEPPLNENSIPKPISPYGASKLSGEGYCSAYFRTFGVETVVLRFSNVYGPYSSHKNSIVAAFVGRALSGKVCEIYGDGEQTRDFLYVGDLIGAIGKAAKVEGIGGEIFQIATGIETSVNQLVEMLNRSLSACGHAMNIEHLASRVGDAHRNYAEVDKARKQLGWSAEVRIEEGLNSTVKWFHDELNAD